MFMGAPNIRKRPCTEAPDPRDPVLLKFGTFPVQVGVQKLPLSCGDLPRVAAWSASGKWQVGPMQQSINVAFGVQRVQ